MTGRPIHDDKGDLLPCARTAIDIFMYIVPTAGMVITYWLATRGTADSQNRDKKDDYDCCYESFHTGYLGAGTETPKRRAEKKVVDWVGV